MEEALEQMQARHRKELRDLQGRITNKKKNASKKTRKGVNDECAQLEREVKERQEAEIRTLTGEPEAQQEEGSAVPPRDTSADALADKLQSASLAGPTVPATGPPPPPQQQQQQQQQQPPAKRRSRQKERLARRAAEAEAAAAAAEAEAAGMADRRGGERARMEDEFRRRGLAEREVRPDGHCLFSAVADQLAQAGVALPAGQPAHRAVRHAAAAYMETHADRFAGFVEEPLPLYAARVRDTAEWGGQLELTALAGAYGLDIRVVQDGRTEVVAPADGEAPAEGRREIWLAYYRHDYGLGEHYNSLRKAEPAK